MKSPRLVGTYWLNDLSCRLFLIEGTKGADFDTAPKKGETMRIRLSGDYTRFDYTLGILEHEVVEALMVMRGHRYEHDDHKSWASDRFIFIFTHAQFGEFIVEAGQFVAACYRDLKRSWYEWQRKPKTKKKSKRRKHGTIS